MPADKLTSNREFLLVFKHIFVVVIGLFALYQVVVAFQAIRNARTSSDGLVVISSRSKVEDFEAIEGARISKKILYLRQGVEFAQVVSKKFGHQPGDISYYLAKNSVPVGLTSEENGLSQLAKITLDTQRSKAFPIIPVIIAFSMALGLFLNVTNVVTAAMLFSSSLLALTKFFDACPVCPRTLVIGIDAALLGAVILSLVPLIFLALRKVDSARYLLIVVPTCIAGWQIYASDASPIQCQYCAIIGGFMGLALGSFNGSAILASSTARPLTWLAPIAVAVGASGYLHFSRSAPQLDTARPLTALGAKVAPKLRNISELGIEPKKSNRIIYIAIADCEACENGLNAILSLELNSIELWYIGGKPPKLGANWKKIPISEEVTSTPVTLLVDENGQVKKIVSGFSQDMSWLKSYTETIRQFSRSSEKGKK